MAEPFKQLINAEVVAQIAHHLGRQAQAGLFDPAVFAQQAGSGLEALELKARVMHLARALAAQLGAAPLPALDALTAALGPPGAHDSQGDDLGTLRTSSAGLAGWAVWPLTEAVVLIALQHPEAAFTALAEMTQRMSAEFAVRPFIVAHPALAHATLAQWAQHPSAHVRRLASEGSRPRLPWGLRLQALVGDPSPTLPLLRRLQDDPSAYVRRSVANHLNDIAKYHPALVAGWLAEHLPDAPAPRQALLRHASRSLIKQGDAAVLAAWGLGTPWQGQAALALSAVQLQVGDSLGLSLQLRSSAAQPQKLAIDYAVHHAKARGGSTAKVFKGWVLTLAPGEQRLLQRQHSFKPVTTRRYHPGAHAVALHINGAEVARQVFELRL